MCVIFVKISEKNKSRLRLNYVVIRKKNQNNIASFKLWKQDEKIQIWKGCLIHIEICYALVWNENLNKLWNYIFFSVEIFYYFLKNILKVWIYRNMPLYQIWNEPKNQSLVKIRFIVLCLCFYFKTLFSFTACDLNYYVRIITKNMSQTKIQIYQFA